MISPIFCQVSESSMLQCNVRQVVAAAAAEEGVETQIADCAATHKQPLTTPELIDCLMIGWLGSS